MDTWGQGQMLREFAQNPQTRQQLRDTMQNIAQNWFNRQQATQGQAPIVMAPPPPPKTDYTPFIIAAAASIVAAIIISKR